MDLMQALREEQSVLDMEINDAEMALLTRTMSINDNALISLTELIRMIEDLDNEAAARAGLLARLRAL